MNREIKKELKTLTEHDKDDIRYKYHVDGMPTYKLAEMFNVSEAAIVLVLGINY